MGRKKSSSSKSQKKEDSSKKNAEGTSIRITSTSEKAYKKMHSSEETSSDEFNIDESRNQQSKFESKPHSCAIDGETSQKETARRLQKERIRASTSKSLAERHSLKITVEETTSSKGKAYKKIASGEGSSLDQLMHAGSTRKWSSRKHSSACSEDSSHLKAPRKMAKKRPSSSKWAIKQHFAERNTDETSQRPQGSGVKIFIKRMHSSEETSSDELIIDGFRIQQEKEYCVIEETSQKETAKRLQKERIRPSNSKSLAEELSLNINVEETSNSKGKTYKKIASDEASFSGELVHAGSSQIQSSHMHFRVCSEDNSHIKASRKWSSSSKSAIKQHFTKRNAEETSQRPQGCGKEISCKRMHSSEKTSSNELNWDESRIQQAQEHSLDIDRETSQKETARRLQNERIRPSTSKSLSEAHSLQINIEETSSSKGKDHKKIDSGEGSFSGELMHASSSGQQSSHMHSRACSEDNRHLKPIREIERKWPSSSKSTIKQHFTKKNAEETLQLPQESGRPCKKINYSEGNSPEESRNEAESPIRSYISATGSNDRSKNENISPSMLLSKNNPAKLCNKLVKDSECQLPYAAKFYNKIEKNSEYKLSYGFFEIGAKDDKKDAVQLESFRSEAGNSGPFRFWGQNNDAIRHSENDDEERVHNSAIGVDDSASAGKSIEPLSKQLFEFFKGQKKKRDKVKNPSSSKIDDAKPQPPLSFRHERKYNLNPITPTINSDVDMKHKNNRTEDADDFSEKPPKIVDNDIAKREGEKLEKTKNRISWSKTNDAENAVFTCGGSNENLVDLKLSPITAENKQGIKRRSNPGNVLRENRLPPHNSSF